VAAAWTLALEPVAPHLTTRTITIPAGAFTPTSHEWHYGNSGRCLYATGGFGKFTAPVFFLRPTVTIAKMTFYGYGNNTGADICIYLYRTRPKDPGGPDDHMGQVCTNGALLDNPRWLWTAAFNPNRITQSTGPYLWLETDGASDLFFYAVAITCTY